MTACMTKTQPDTLAQSQAARSTRQTFTPRVDVWETEHEFLVHVEMPGVKPGDINLNYENGHLTVQGKVKAEETQPRFINREYAVGDYFRTFSVNDDVDAGKITAEYKLGVLTVKLPKREEIKPKKIDITI